MSLPSFVGSSLFTGGTGGVSPALPAGLAAGDLLLLLVETANEAATLFGVGHGYTELACSPQGTGPAPGSTATRLTAFWKLAGAIEAAPIVNDAGDHVGAVLCAFRGVDPVAPINVCAGGVDSISGTNGNLPSVTTTVNDCLVLWALSSAVDSAAARFSNWRSIGSLVANLTECVDGGSTAGNGGGIGLCTGEKANAGVTGPGLVTTAASANGHMTIAIAGVP